MVNHSGGSGFRIGPSASAAALESGPSEPSPAMAGAAAAATCSSRRRVSDGPSKVAAPPPSPMLVSIPPCATLVLLAVSYLVDRQSTREAAGRARGDRQATSRP